MSIPEAYREAGCVEESFINNRTGQKERKVFPNADTLRVWIASMCNEGGDYRLKDIGFNPYFAGGAR
jgi:hypothetical protein